MINVPVGQDVYKIEQAAERLRCDGQLVAARIDHASRHIALCASVSLQDLPAVAACAVAQAWRERLDMYAADLRRKWNAFEVAAEAFGADGPLDGPDEDDGPQFIAAFDELVRMGVKFDPTFAAIAGGMKPSGIHNTESFTEVGDWYDLHAVPVGRPGMSFCKIAPARKNFERAVPVAPEGYEYAASLAGIVPSAMSVYDTTTPTLPCIEFHVGATPYMLIISDRSIFDSDGCELEGCAVEGRRLLILSHIVHPERREEVARHEFYHAWRFHVPAPKNEEEDAQLHALVAKQFRVDLDDAGGQDALLNIRPCKVLLGRPPGDKLINPVAPIKRPKFTTVQAGPANWTVGVSPRRLERWTIVDTTRQVILICPSAEREFRIKVLIDALFDAWSHEWGKPVLSGQWRDRSAELLWTLHRDIERQGGAEALEAMEPDHGFDAVLKAHALEALQALQSTKQFDFELTYVETDWRPWRCSCGKSYSKHHASIAALKNHLMNAHLLAPDAAQALIQAARNSPSEPPAEERD